MHKNKNINGKHKSLDDHVMEHVSCAVRMVNWATGLPKSRIANLLVDVTAVSFPLASWLAALDSQSLSITGFALTSTPIMVLICHAVQEENTKREKLEIQALESNMINPYAHSQRISDIVYGYGNLLVGSIALVFAPLDPPSSVMSITSDTTFATAFFALGLSMFVMRTELMPPQKNLLRRGLEKLKEAWRSTLEQPSPAAVQVEAGISGALRG